MEDKLKHYLEVAYGSTNRLITLVQDMLTISRIEGNRYEISPVKVDLQKVMKQMYEELNIKATEKNIKFTLVDYPEQLLIKADKDKIREVFQNIAGNALKFTPKEGSVTITYDRKDKIIEVHFADTGPGIAKEDIPKLFQKFNRFSNSYTKISDLSGTGLGLYIAKQIISLHQGKIEVKSDQGKGCIFTISLPEHIE